MPRETRLAVAARKAAIGAVAEDQVDHTIQPPSETPAKADEAIEAKTNGGTEAETDEGAGTNTEVPKVKVKAKVKRTPQPKRVQPRKVSSATKPKPKWDARNILTSEKSPLAEADIREIIQHPIAWDILSPLERQNILNLFPSEKHILNPGSDHAEPSIAGLLNDDSFRSDAAQYVDDLKWGKHDPQWLAEANAAHDLRRAGEFKNFLRRKLEADWGIPMSAEDSEKGSSVAESSGNGSPKSKDVPVEKVGMVETAATDEMDVSSSTGDEGKMGD